MGILSSSGFSAKKVPLSGSLGGEHSGDIKLEHPLKDGHYQCEVKSRANNNGYKTVIDWLTENNNDLLILDVSREMPVVAMTYKVFEELYVASLRSIKDAPVSASPLGRATPSRRGRSFGLRDSHGEEE